VSCSLGKLLTLCFLFQVNPLKTMGNNTQACVNNNLGSNITHIANAYQTREGFVRVCLHEKETKIETLDMEVSPNVSMNTKLKRETNQSCFNVPYNSVHKAERKDSWSYMTVKADGKGESLCSKMLIAANKSFIVTRQGGIEQQKYGSNNLWQDENGFNHCPSP